ncbi:MAG: glucose-1-phosphate cytidylyltransferase [Gammaproteobacteria bacterium]|nr:MAG: glucose-1-phosphate cytidylyltransferase [Gammaproteobacteria bacterium]
MKVVIFCGGLGTRLREHSDTIPKPLVGIGYRPILWHLMKFYAHHGHKDFILCLGYRGDLIKDFFRNYDPYQSADFVMRKGGRQMEPAASDIDDWSITFAETGLHSNIGQRLAAVRHYLGDDEMFLANYGDQLSDLPLPEYLSRFQASGAVAGFVAVRPSQSFHTARFGADGMVTAMGTVEGSDVWINGGYLALRRSIFDYMREREELVEAPFQRLIAEQRLFAYRYEGFWKSMDTFKDKITYDRMHGQGNTPWEVWRENRAR